MPCLIGLVSACASPIPTAGIASPIPTSLPTASITRSELKPTPTGHDKTETATATAWNYPSATMVPTIGHPSSTPTRMPLPATTPLAQVQPVQILAPGDGSRVVSPLSITILSAAEGGDRNGMVIPNSSAVMTIELRDQAGRLLVRQLLTGIPSLYSTSLDFEIPIPSQAGRLVVLLEDSPGHLLAVDSVGLVLFSGGLASIEKPTPRPVILIQDPVPGASVAGGNLQVSGLTQLDPDQPLRVQLISSEGNIIGQRLAGISPQDAAGQAVFTASVPYKVNEATPARLVVFQTAGSNNYLIFLASVDLILEP